jgi:hypothetical protein
MEGLRRRAGPVLGHRPDTTTRGPKDRFATHLVPFARCQEPDSQAPSGHTPCPLSRVASPDLCHNLTNVGVCETTGSSRDLLSVTAPDPGSLRHTQKADPARRTRASRRTDATSESAEGSSPGCARYPKISRTGAGRSLNRPRASRLLVPPTPDGLRCQKPARTVSSARGTGDTGGVPYDPTIYLGSAAHYRYGRPAYHYLGSTRRAGQGAAPQRTHRFEDVLARTRFGVPQQFFVPGIPDLLRDCESVLSGYERACHRCGAGGPRPQAG